VPHTQTVEDARERGTSCGRRLVVVSRNPYTQGERGQRGSASRHPTILIDRRSPPPAACHSLHDRRKSRHRRRCHRGGERLICAAAFSQPSGWKAARNDGLVAPSACARRTTGRRALGRRTSRTERAPAMLVMWQGGWSPQTPARCADVRRRARHKRPPASSPIARNVLLRRWPTASRAKLHLRSSECLGDGGSVDSESLADRSE
jgi:hypothetical protein